MDIGEDAMVCDILKGHDDCLFCRSDGHKPADLKSYDDPDPEEDDDGAVIGNNSGKLGRSMEGVKRPRPADWVIRIEPVDGTKHTVVPNPHHLIPGNEALKRTPDILPWIFQNKKKIESDIGYDVNHHLNGIWLPSNNGMRKDTRWDKPDFKTDYVESAMDESGVHFHDRHVDYSHFVTRILQKIADRMHGLDGANASCPKHPPEKKGPWPPPYGLIHRLNAVSNRLAGHLAAGAAPTPFIYTSKLVLDYWERKKKPIPGIAGPTEHKYQSQQR